MLNTPVLPVHQTTREGKPLMWVTVTWRKISRAFSHVLAINDLSCFMSMALPLQFTLCLRIKRHLRSKTWHVTSYWGQPGCCSATWICIPVCGCLCTPVTYSKFHQDTFMAFGSTSGRNLALPSLAIGFYYYTSTLQANSYLTPMLKKLTMLVNTTTEFVLEKLKFPQIVHSTCGSYIKICTLFYHFTGSN